MLLLIILESGGNVNCQDKDLKPNMSKLAMQNENQKNPLNPLKILAILGSIIGGGLTGGIVLHKIKKFIEFKKKSSMPNLAHLSDQELLNLEEEKQKNIKFYERTQKDMSDNFKGDSNSFYEILKNQLFEIRQVKAKRGIKVPETVPAIKLSNTVSDNNDNEKIKAKEDINLPMHLSSSTSSDTNENSSVPNSNNMSSDINKKIKAKEDINLPMHLSSSTSSDTNENSSVPNSNNMSSDINDKEIKKNSNYINLDPVFKKLIIYGGQIKIQTNTGIDTEHRDIKDAPDLIQEKANKNDEYCLIFNISDPQGNLSCLAKVIIDSKEKFEKLKLEEIVCEFDFFINGALYQLIEVRCNRCIGDSSACKHCNWVYGSSRLRNSFRSFVLIPKYPKIIGEPELEPLIKQFYEHIKKFPTTDERAIINCDDLNYYLKEHMLELKDKIQSPWPNYVKVTRSYISQSVIDGSKPLIVKSSSNFETEIGIKNELSFVSNSIHPFDYSGEKLILMFNLTKDNFRPTFEFSFDSGITYKRYISSLVTENGGVFSCNNASDKNNFILTLASLPKDIQAKIFSDKEPNTIVIKSLCYTNGIDFFSIDSCLQNCIGLKVYVADDEYSSFLDDSYLEDPYFDKKKYLELSSPLHGTFIDFLKDNYSQDKNRICIKFEDLKDFDKIQQIHEFSNSYKEHLKKQLLCVYGFSFDGKPDSKNENIDSLKYINIFNEKFL